MNEGSGDLDEVASADVDEDAIGVVESAGDVERGGERDEERLSVGAEREIVECGGGEVEARCGSANVAETVLKKVDFEIRLLFQRLQLLHAQLLHSSSAAARRRRRRSHFAATPAAASTFFSFFFFLFLVF